MSKIAFLGLGRMGKPMAARLAAAGNDLVVWNRTASAAVAFAAEHGVESADDRISAVAGAEFVVTMLADDIAVLDAYLGSDGALSTMAPGSIAIDMSTVSPLTVARLNDESNEVGVKFIDAPVSGSVAAAAAGTLTIMAAGDADVIETSRTLLEQMGHHVVVMGTSGSGASMKLVVNSIVHSLNGAVSEALVLAERAGIDRESAYAVFLHSAISAPFVAYRQDAFERPGEVPVAFRLELAAKDLRLAIELADRVGAELPQAETNLRVIGEAVEAGYGQADESAVAAHLRSKADRRPTR